MTTEERIRQLMIENGLNASDEQAFLTVSIIYQEAQADYIKDKLKEIKK